MGASVMSAEYSATPLSKKPEIKQGLTMVTINAPAHYTELILPLPEAVSMTSDQSADFDLLHLFTKSRAELTEVLTRHRNSMKPSAVIWVSWPKKASKIPSEITEGVIREICLPMGLVDIKVCAVDQVWSGLKLVIKNNLRQVK
jgi:hypothetical protein